MIVCVAEKPSVGEYIARVLGANQRRNGYFEGNGYQVTWTFGHLCALLDPQEYTDQWKGWNLSTLPMIPPRFSIKVHGDEGVHKQFNVIKSLIEQADEVINCGDAGQEGELIQRWVYQQAGCKCPVKRLWVSSLTEEAIREGFQTLKDQSEYQHLYEAGMMRAIGDWLLGMNATRAYTIRYARGTGRDRQVLSVGRVQTPTLALVVKRQAEIEHFVPKTYWELKTNYRDTLFSAQIPVEDGEYAITSEEQGRTLVDSIKDLPLVITSVEKKKGLEYAPKLYDLTSLQVDCNKKYSFSAEQTLQLIQSLYEKRVTTYPRVDTTFLSDDIFPKVPGILKGIEPYFPQVSRLRERMKQEQEKTGKQQKLPKSKKVFDNSKVTDHHAIIPTGQAPKALTPDEQKVFNMVALRFIAAFYPECKTSTTTVWGNVADNQDRNKPDGNGVLFKTSGKQILDPGWRVVLPPKSSAEQDPSNSEGKEETTVLPHFTKGESGPHQPTLTEKMTTPPPYYTEATLLRAMETAGKFVEDEELRAAMKENGIGRPSSRASIIETLFKRRYIKRERKRLVATETGMELIDLIREELLKSCELTGIWEKKLRDIEHQKYDAQQFINELKAQVTAIVNDVMSDPSNRRVTVLPEQPQKTKKTKETNKQ